MAISNQGSKHQVIGEQGVFWELIRNLLWAEWDKVSVEIQAKVQILKEIKPSIFHPKAMSDHDRILK
jgi:hypothetical protein